ncbi:MAG: hypothetical protein IJU03_00065 [Thermoguttaceae bacterium]|nr:hypothetical protein [Thermoguttaceae bacterium]
MTRSSANRTAMGAIAIALIAISFVVASGKLYAGDQLDEILAKFAPIPDASDQRWREVPSEQFVEKLQFFLDRQNENYNKIKTWSGRYFISRRSYFEASPQIVEQLRSVETVKSHYNVSSDVYTFYQDVKKEKLFFSRELKDQERFTPDGAPFESEWIRTRTNVRAVFTPEEADVFYYDEERRIPEPFQDQFPEGVAKFCTINDPSTTQFSPIGEFFNPQFLFGLLALNHTRWEGFGTVYIPILSGEKGEERKNEFTSKVKIFECEIDGVEWVRIERDFGDVVERYVLNGAVGYNIVFTGQNKVGQEARSPTMLEYAKVDDVYIPSKLLWAFPEFRGEQNDSTDEILCNYLYCEMIDARVNQKIPGDQFTLKALGLGDSVMIYNRITNTFSRYEEEDGEGVPFAKFNPNALKNPGVKTAPIERIVPARPFWRSPARLIAFALGVVLILFGVYAKFRRKKTAS